MAFSFKNVANDMNIDPTETHKARFEEISSAIDQEKLYRAKLENQISSIATIVKVNETSQSRILEKFVNIMDEQAKSNGKLVDQMEGFNQLMTNMLRVNENISNDFKNEMIAHFNTKAQLDKVIEDNKPFYSKLKSKFFD